MLGICAEVKHLQVEFHATTFYFLSLGACTAFHTGYWRVITLVFVYVMAAPE